MVLPPSTMLPAAQFASVALAMPQLPAQVQLQGVSTKKRSPSLLLAHTVKGQGIPMVAGRVQSHYATLSPRMHARARAALRGGGGDG